MNVTSCNDIMRVVHPSQSVPSVDLLREILPNLCQIIKHINDSLVTFEEQIFYNHCCDHMPFTTLNKTGIYEDETNEQHFLHDVCHYMRTNGTADEERLYQEICLPSSGHGIHLSLLSPEWRLLTITVIVLLAPIGLFANSLILLTYYKIQRLRNATGYFICHLAISALLSILLMLLLLSLYALGGMSNASRQVHVYLLPSFDTFIGSSFLLHTTAVSIERGIAVSKPLKHLKYVNITTTKRCLIVIWIYCFALLIIGLLRIKITSELYLILFSLIVATLSLHIPCLLVVMSYSFILVSACRNIRKEKKYKNTQTTDHLIRKSLSKSQARFREIKTALNVALMVSPVIGGLVYSMGGIFYEDVIGRDIIGFQNWLLPFVPFIISCVNPLIYITCTRSLRTNSKMILYAWYTSFKTCLCN